MKGAQRPALVTGGAGFIGSHLVDALLDQGFRVRVIDDFSSGREENLADARGRFELLRGDFTDPEVAARAVEGVELVFHQGAVPSVPRSVAEPVRTNRVNVDGTLAVLEAARRAGVRRLVYAASSSAYGDTEVLPKVETLPADPRSPYALQKHVGEVYCRLYHELYGLETVALRYFNVFGPRQDPRSTYAAVVPRFASACLRGEPPRIHGDGEQSRDFTYVADTVRANLLAADAPGAVGRVINVAGGRRIAMNRLLAEIQEIVGSELEPIHEPARPGDVRHSLADLSRARDLLGFEPAVPLAEGLRRTIESLKG
ncbi:MAG TPA: SDR family oxidoreductase [Myxococcota bacterium]|nr:SDR family oxidoreductase [Myxococcota bacterium]